MRKSRIFGLVLFALPAALGLIGASLAQENVGTVQQGLVAGKEVPAKTQEEFGLLSLGSGCSASLLRNGWAITAAHCVDAKDAAGNTMPDPNRPGQNILQPINTFTLTANWEGAPQMRRAVRVETFWPYDVALIQVDAPFSVRDPMIGGRRSTTGYSRLIFRDGQFPYYGNPVGASLVLFGRGIHIFAKDASTPSVNDGKYRTAFARPNRNEGILFWYPSEGGKMIAGGDSGGPSFAWVYGGYALVGVHALTHANYVPGKPKKDWDWVTSTPEAADAPIAPVWDKISAIMGPRPKGESEFSLDSPPPGYIGEFGKTPPNYQPLWVYGIRPNGEMVWYRKDTNATAWQGPKVVGQQWQNFKDVIPAGGNRFYALTQDNRLLWYQHDGFNNGSGAWKGGNPIGTGWGFKRIFSGGEGIIYAIREDGKLFWYRHTGLNDGSRSWIQGKEVGSAWNTYKDVFSTGQGAVYAVAWDGTLWLFQQIGYETGNKSWHPARKVGSGWQAFKQIIPVGDGVILVTTYDGKLLWYRHHGKAPASRIAVAKEVWEGPVELGFGWHGFNKVVSLIPLANSPAVR